MVSARRQSLKHQRNATLEGQGSTVNYNRVSFYKNSNSSSLVYISSAQNYKRESGLAAAGWGWLRGGARGWGITGTIKHIYQVIAKHSPCLCCLSFNLALRALREGFNKLSRVSPHPRGLNVILCYSLCGGDVVWGGGWWEWT